MNLINSPAGTLPHGITGITEDLQRTTHATRNRSGNDACACRIASFPCMWYCKRREVGRWPGNEATCRRLLDLSSCFTARDAHAHLFSAQRQQ